ncbi:MAG: gamma-glutamylcyclotransferase [Ahrensia sp.]|nr:gamma-glutamylcyclotransferase [Ahrensia sp.]|tara:strand:- start:1522 stop:2172 length:651 start_codon:yes stop_codon:yes gene_type:complete
MDLMTPEQLDTIFLAAQKGDLFAYFGYGSLVNRDTHRTEIYGAVRAKVRGWRRHWQGRPQHGDSPISLLSVKAESDPDHELPGLLVFDRIENLGALDEREFNYHRRTVEAGAIVLPVEMSMEVPVFIYEGKPEVAPGTDHAILQSYLDAVLQGYLLEYGEDEVRRFIADTHAFDHTPIIRDRHEPRYMRSVALRDEEAQLFDETLAANGVKYREMA